MTRPKAVRRPEYDQLLLWLSPDPDAAEREFRRLRDQLIRILVGRGCLVPEDLADDVIERVARKLPEISVGYEGDPALYFYAVAKNVHREYVRRPQLSFLKREPRATEMIDDPTETHLRCLDQCLDTLKEEEQSLILDYYSLDRSDKAVRRKAIASQTGVGVNALRIRAYRIRNKLFECVTACLQAATA